MFFFHGKIGREAKIFFLTGHLSPNQEIFFIAIIFLPFFSVFLLKRAFFLCLGVNLWIIVKRKNFFCLFHHRQLRHRLRHRHHRRRCYFSYCNHLLIKLFFFFLKEAKDFRMKCSFGYFFLIRH